MNHADEPGLYPLSTRWRSQQQRVEAALGKESHVQAQAVCQAGAMLYGSDALFVLIAVIFVQYLPHQQAEEEQHQHGERAFQRARKRTTGRRGSLAQGRRLIEVAQTEILRCCAKTASGAARVPWAAK